MIKESKTKNNRNDILDTTLNLSDWNWMLECVDDEWHGKDGNSKKRDEALLSGTAGNETRWTGFGEKPMRKGEVSFAP